MSCSQFFIIQSETAMNNTDKVYIETVRQILENGNRKDDRTGTGTISSFGHQMRFDLNEGFPLLTTKKMFVRGVVAELLWFISGSTNVKDLQEMGVNFWDPWMGEDGTIGQGYGKQLRNIEHIGVVTPWIYDPEDSDIPLEERTVFGVGALGDYDANAPLCSELQDVWRDMMKRCYYKESKSYKSYGEKGVHVCPRWHTFANFLEDAQKLNNWCLKLEYPEDYTLDKDVLHASNRYCLNTCMWTSHAVQSANTSTNKYFKAVSPDGETFLFTSIGETNRKHSLNLSAVHRCLTGKLRTHHGWSEFSYLNSPIENGVFRYNEKDQLKEVICSLKHDPDSRRHLITLWNPHEVDRATLPPCHGVAIQFYVANKKLSCSMYQRSADMFLGVPVNIASYALLTHMLAQVTGLKVGELIWSGGDCHIYSNHIEQVKEQIRRFDNGEVYDLPKLKLNPDIKDIDDFTFDDIELIGYQSGSAIKGKVAV